MWIRTQFLNQNGTTTVTLTISSGRRRSIPAAVTVLVNAPQPSQRGTIVNIPGHTWWTCWRITRACSITCCARTLNQVLVFNGTNNTQIAALRTCTNPTSLAETFDGNKLLVGCNNTHIMSVFDLNALQPLTSVDTGSGYVQSVAVSNGMNLAVMRDGGGGPPYIASIDLILNHGHASCPPWACIPEPGASEYGAGFVSQWVYDFAGLGRRPHHAVRRQRKLLHRFAAGFPIPGRSLCGVGVRPVRGGPDLLNSSLAPEATARDGDGQFLPVLSS